MYFFVPFSTVFLQGWGFGSGDFPRQIRMRILSPNHRCVNNIIVSNCISVLISVFLFCSFGFSIRWLLISLCAHAEKIGISICLRHLVTSKESSNLREKIVKDLFYTCARCVELPSYISPMDLKKQEQIVKRSEAIYRYGNR